MDGPSVLPGKKVLFKEPAYMCPCQNNETIYMYSVIRSYEILNKNLIQLDALTQSINKAIHYPPMVGWLEIKNINTIESYSHLLHIIMIKC